MDRAGRNAGRAALGRFVAQDEGARHGALVRRKFALWLRDWHRQTLHKGSDSCRSLGARGATIENPQWPLGRACRPAEAAKWHSAPRHAFRARRSLLLHGRRRAAAAPPGSGSGSGSRQLRVSLPAPAHPVSMSRAYLAAAADSAWRHAVPRGRAAAAAAVTSWSPTRICSVPSSWQRSAARPWKTTGC